jgi:hypothetical protein
MERPNTIFLLPIVWYWGKIYMCVCVCVCVNTLICHMVGSAQNVCLVIGGHLVIGVSTLIVTKMCLLNIIFF